MAWTVETAAGHDRIMAARYPASGALTPIGAPVELTALFASNPSAYYPAVAVATNGDAVVAWTQPASAGGGVTAVWVSRYSASSDAWSNPTELVGPASALTSAAPVVAAGPQGQFTVAWFGATGGNPNGTGAFVAARYAGAWGTPVAISPTYPMYSEDWSINSDDIGIAADGLGNVMVLWGAKRRGGAGPEVSRVLSTRFTAGGTWASAASPDVVFAATDTSGATTQVFSGITVAANATGGFVAAWRNFESGTVIQASRYGQSGWGSEDDLAGPSGGRSNPSLTIGADGTATAAWVEWSSDEVKARQSLGSTPTVWGSTLSVPGGGVGAADEVRIGSSTAGDVTAVWDGEDATTNQYKIQANQLPSAGSAWSAPTTLQSGAYQNANWYDLLQYPTLVVAPSGVATAAWDDIVNETPDDNVHPAEYSIKGSRYEGGQPSPGPQPDNGGSSQGGSSSQSGGSTPAARTQAQVTIPSQLARTGLPVSAGGEVRLPLSCPAGLSAACDATGQLSVTLPRAVNAERRKADQALGRVRVLSRFRGVEIASGTTRLYTVRLAPKTYTALRKAGVRRIPANLRIVNQLAGGAPVITTQRVWLKIRPMGTVPVTG